MCVTSDIVVGTAMSHTGKPVSHLCRTLMPWSRPSGVMYSKRVKSSRRYMSSSLAMATACGVAGFELAHLQHCDCHKWQNDKILQRSNETHGDRFPDVAACYVLSSTIIAASRLMHGLPGNGHAGVTRLGHRAKPTVTRLVGPALEQEVQHREALVHVAPLGRRIPEPEEQHRLQGLESVTVTTGLSCPGQAVLCFLTQSALYCTGDTGVG